MAAHLPPDASRPEDHPSESRQIWRTFWIQTGASLAIALALLTASLLLTHPRGDFTWVAWVEVLRGATDDLRPLTAELLGAAGVVTALYIATSLGRRMNVTVAEESRLDLIASVTYFASIALAVIGWVVVGTTLARGPGAILSALYVVVIVGLLCGLAAASHRSISSLHVVRERAEENLRLLHERRTADLTQRRQAPLTKEVAIGVALTLVVSLAVWLLAGLPVPAWWAALVLLPLIGWQYLCVNHAAQFRAREVRARRARWFDTGIIALAAVLASVILGIASYVESESAAAPILVAVLTVLPIGYAAVRRDTPAIQARLDLYLSREIAFVQTEIRRLDHALDAEETDLGQLLGAGPPRS